MSIAEHVTRTVKVIDRQYHQGAVAGNNSTNNQDLFASPSITPVAGHRYWIIACGTAVLDVTNTGHKMRHLLAAGSSNVASAQVGVTRGPWGGGQGLYPLRVSGVWTAPNATPVVFKWVLQSDAARTGPVLGEGTHAFFVIDLGPPS